MLYDKKRWEKPKQPEHPSLEGFIAWLETKPPKEDYNWVSIRQCACGQYAEENGLSRQWVQRSPAFAIWERLDLIAMSSNASNITAQTFGKCLKRARRALKQEVYA